jgi:hypothetical protein
LFGYSEQTRQVQPGRQRAARRLRGAAIRRHLSR